MQRSLYPVIALAFVLFGSGCEDGALTFKWSLQDKKPDIEDGFVDPFPCLALSAVIHGQADFGYGRSALQVFQLHITSQITDQNHSIETCHDVPPC